jgi:hypothetical protein
VLKDRYGALLAALRTTWAELGVEISVETPDMAAFLDSFEKCSGFDVLIGRWNIDYPDPDNIARSLFHSGPVLSALNSSDAADRLSRTPARADPRPETLCRVQACSSAEYHRSATSTTASPDRGLARAGSLLIFPAGWVSQIDCVSLGAPRRRSCRWSW